MHACSKGSARCIEQYSWESKHELRSIHFRALEPRTKAPSAVPIGRGPADPFSASLHPADQGHTAAAGSSDQRPTNNTAPLLFHALTQGSPARFRLRPSLPHTPRERIP